jgi:hypothetical protein
LCPSSTADLRDVRDDFGTATVVVARRGSPPPHHQQVSTMDKTARGARKPSAASNRGGCRRPASSYAQLASLPARQRHRAAGVAWERDRLRAEGGTAGCSGGRSRGARRRRGPAVGSRRGGEKQVQEWGRGMARWRRMGAVERDGEGARRSASPVDPSWEEEEGNGAWMTATLMRRGRKWGF